MVSTPVSQSSCSDATLMDVIRDDRWKALRDMIDEFVGSNPPGSVVSRYAGATVPRWEALQPVIERLRTFAGSQYDYFHSGFAPLGELVASTEIPPDSVYSAILNQAGNDLDVIQSIVLQRLSGLSIEKTVLEEADKLAMFSLLPAIGTKLLEEETTVLTYFQKSPRIQVVPYAPVALIGIPFTAIRTFSDLLGTAHEAGHYVFWHGRIETAGKPRSEWPFLYQILRDEVDAVNLPEWCSVWLEELFADIYGCLVFGPVAAVSSQELQRSRTRGEFVHSDNDHPVPRLRPTVYQKVLQQSAIAARRHWADKLDRRWTNLVNSRDLVSTSTFIVSGVKNIDTDVLIGQATGQIDKLINLILAHLQGIEDHWPQLLPYPALPPLAEDNDDATLCSLYQWFETVHQVVLSRVSVSNTLPPANLNTLWLDWFKEHGFDGWPTSLEWKTPTNPKTGWGFILEAAGWATEPQQKPWP
jgi:hypothetical protein